MSPARRPNRLSGLVIVRRFRPMDSQACHRVFFDAVHGGTQEFYSDIERIAWAPHEGAPETWTNRLDRNETVVAEAEGRLIGFMSLTQGGHLDLAFVTPLAMGTGVAGRLYDALEDWAHKQSLPVLTTDASHLAKRFFGKRGWAVLCEQTALSNGHAIVNFRMEKPLCGVK